MSIKKDIAILPSAHTRSRAAKRRHIEKAPKQKRQSQIELKAAESQSTTVDPKEFRRLLRKIIEEDRELLEQIGRL